MALTIEIVTPSRQVLKETCDEIYIPGEEGEFGVLPEHAGLVTKLGTGQVRLQSGSTQKHLAIREGFAQILENGVTVLAKEAVEANNVDKVKLEEEAKELEAKLASTDVEDEARDQLFANRDWITARREIL